jgi:hypothetical protein
MAYRLLGAIVLLGSVGVAVLGFWEFAQTSTMTAALPLVAPEIDVRDWAFHWRMSSTFLLAAGIFGVCAGLGLVFLERWALALLAAVSAIWVMLQFGTALIGYSRYPFEALDPVELILVSVISLGALLEYRRGSKRATDA